MSAHQKDTVFLKLFEAARMANLNKDEFTKYQESLKAYHEIKNSVEIAREEGILKAKIEIAKNLKSKGFAVSDIAEITGLTAPEIEKI
jgi:predicted transposase/invertase (TIGR01784 family)